MVGTPDYDIAITNGNTSECCNLCSIDDTCIAVVYSIDHCWFFSHSNYTKYRPGITTLVKNGGKKEANSFNIEKYNFCILYTKLNFHSLP